MNNHICQQCLTIIDIDCGDDAGVGRSWVVVQSGCVQTGWDSATLGRTTASVGYTHEVSIIVSLQSKAVIHSFLYQCISLCICSDIYLFTLLFHYLSFLKQMFSFIHSHNFYIYSFSISLLSLVFQYTCITECLKCCTFDICFRHCRDYSKIFKKGIFGTFFLLYHQLFFFFQLI